MNLKNNKEITRFLKFSVVGAIGAVVDFGVLNLFLFLNFSYVLSGTISFIAAVLNNFILNRYWTYPDSRSKSLGKQMVQFVIINVIGLIIRIPLLAWLEDILINFFSQNIPADFFLSAEFIGHNSGLAIAILIVMLWNFFANRYWTFNDVES